MPFFSKRKRIIKKAVKLTAAAIKDKSPQVYMHFFYGAFDIDPKNLVVWFLFETDNELTKAKQSGLCEEIKNLTAKNLIAEGYPCEALNKNTVSFTSQEDIDKKANGNHHLYFQ
mgnify:CR=1 FL=1